MGISSAKIFAKVEKTNELELSQKLTCRHWVQTPYLLLWIRFWKTTDKNWFKFGHEQNMWVKLTLTPTAVFTYVSETFYQPSSGKVYPMNNLNEHRMGLHSLYPQAHPRLCLVLPLRCSTFNHVFLLSMRGSSRPVGVLAMLNCLLVVNPGCIPISHPVFLTSYPTPPWQG